MKYNSITSAYFLDRPNRFVAHVDLGGSAETVHVKNTGRCRELLLPGAEVFLEQSANPARKTAYDLVAVRRGDGSIVNIDSQAPNKVAAEWLAGQGFDRIVPEFRWGDSRFDFYMERGGERWLLEVKSCTLQIGSWGYFPDAPTERGVKHLRELAKAAREGWHAAVAFVIQMEGVWEVRPNVTTQPAFGEALAEAKSAGVQVLCLPCRVTPSSLQVLPDAPRVEQAQRKR
ncbi:MAG: DNA/RNA nuclease SfsA [Clostridia bacterium]|nr:DNA/RNA nuclease SfsA [Clostridia bacterium]